MSDLFTELRPIKQEIYPEVFVLANFVETLPLIHKIQLIIQQAPFRKMMTPMGHYTGIPLTNCGEYGWISDISGYRYSKKDPITNNPWPEIPDTFIQLATNAANTVGYSNFIPDACLINQYEIGSKLGTHQDKNEADFSWPIVSVSLGLSATFQIFGEQRSGKPIEYQVQDGDVMVWGGKSRLIYHGVKTVKQDNQQPQKTQRFNLTFRKAG